MNRRRNCIVAGRVRANANAGLIIQAGMDAWFANSEPMVNYRPNADRISFLRLHPIRHSNNLFFFLFTSSFMGKNFSSSIIFVVKICFS